MKQTNDQTHERPPDETIKETFESIVIAFILAFVFRAYVVEAFVIPTGSMAPTLLGAHYSVHCPQCGYGFTINSPGNARGDAICTMCRYNISMPQIVRPLPGDRILVHKYVFSISEPRRWDVVVFKAPHDPNTNFIKRLVGLPNESIHLLDGNVYTQPKGQDTWRIARKSDRPKVQRAVWQPIYYSQYIPRDGGALMGPGTRTPGNRWKVPWVAQQGQWDLEHTRSYRFDGQGVGRIGFDFHLGGHLRPEGVYPYNQYNPSRYWDKIEDIRLATTVQPQGPGCKVGLSTQTRLDGDGHTQTVTATIEPDGAIHLTATDPQTGETQELMAGRIQPLAQDRTTSIELWAVDQEICVWVDGKRALRYVYASELSFEQLINRPPPQMTPTITIEVSGGPAVFHQVELDRDLYYASRSTHPSAYYYARGGLFRQTNGEIELTSDRVQPMDIQDNEFFCIGDNSPLSDDGRFWSPGLNYKDINSHALWVRQRYFDRALDDATRDGIVPGKLMMGRAFFVYFPAPFPWDKNAGGIIPNFADMRFIH